MVKNMDYKEKLEEAKMLSTYPLGKWHEVEHLSTDLSEPQVIIEDHYSE